MLIENRRKPGHYVMGANPAWLPSFGRGVGGGWSTVPSMDLQLASDPLRAELMGMEFRSPPVDLLGLLGLEAPEEEIGGTGLIQHLGYEPSKDLHVSKMSKLYLIANAMRFLQGNTSEAVGAAREHAVSHSSPIGRVDTHLAATSEWPNVSENALRADLRVVDVGSSSRPYYVVEQVGSAVNHYLMVHPTTRPEHRLLELKEIMQGPGFEPAVHDPDFNYKVTDLRWKTDSHGNVNRVYYRIQVTCWGGVSDGYTPFLALKEVAVCFTIEWFAFPYTNITIGQPIGWIYPGLYPAKISMGRHLTRHMVRQLHEPPNWYSSFVGLDTPLDAFDDVVVGYAIPSEPYYRSWICEGDKPSKFLACIGWDAVSHVYRDNNRGDFVKFVRFANSLSSDMLPAAFFAQGAALNEGYQVLNANILETALEIKDLASPVALGTSLYKILTSHDLVAGSFLRRSPREQVFRILDFLADYQLTYSFGYKPVEKLAKEAAEWAPKVANAIANATKWQTFRGTYKYDLSDNESPYPGAYILGHSKIRCRVPPDSFLPLLFQADALGILPSMSRIWDVLPLSFIWDWFFNISGKLEAIDLVTKLSVIQVAYVINSVSFVAPFSAEQQETYQFTVDQTVDSNGHKRPTGYCHYVRYVLPTWQMMTPTKLAFLDGKGIPDFKVAGALCYKFLT